jgi:tRNA threonylcarbamoyladenosine biosynthesis protein TsaB
LPVKPPLTLAIETSNPSAQGTEGSRPAVALVGGGLGGQTLFETLAIEAVDTSPHTDDLVAAIDRLFKHAQRLPRDLTHVAVSSGPGGFTAVRLAVTAAKMICEATGAACIAVPTAHALARRVSDDAPFGVALASKGNTTYLTRFSAEGKPLDEGKIIDAEGLEATGITLLIVDQFVPEPIRDRAAELNIRVSPTTFDPVAVAEAAQHIAPIDPADLLPIYPREPEAVTKWKQLHGQGGPQEKI